MNKKVSIWDVQIKEIKNLIPVQFTNSGNFELKEVESSSKKISTESASLN